MELKQVNKCVCDYSPNLLIVPYGIETTFEVLSLRRLLLLLIVPYGIETT